MSLMREFLRVLKVAHFTLAYPVDPGFPGIVFSVLMWHHRHNVEAF
jgi:hypothetical protein